MKIAVSVMWMLMLTASAEVLAIGSHLETEDCEYGEVYAFNHAECEITLINSGDTPIHVSEFRSDKAEDKVTPITATVPPHAKAYVKATVSTGNDIGRARHVFHFLSDEQGHEQRLFAARGFVLSVLDEGRPIVDLGVVDLESALPSRTVELASHDLADFRVEKVISKPDYVDVQLAPNAQGLTFKLRDNAPWGYQGDYIKLRTNAAAQNEIWVGVQSDIHGKVVPASNPFSMGVMRVGSQNEHRIRLTSRDGKDFNVGKIELEKLRASTAVELCQPLAAGCRMIKLRVADDQPIGSVVGKLMVDLPDFSQHLLIAVNGIFLGKDAKIEKLDAADLVNKANQKDGKASVASSPIDMNSAIKSAVQAAEEGVPPGKGPLLKWSVVNETAIHGYQIFRASSENGPFVLLNKATLPVKNRQASGSTYQWRDNSAETGKTFWYYIGTVYNDGRKQQLTGPQKVVAK